MQLPDGTAIIETELKHTTVGGVWGGGGAERVIPIMAYTGRLRLKGVPFS